MTAERDTDGQHGPIWLETTPETAYDPLDGTTRVDTAVIGGGIAGISTAFALQEAGQSVALLERDRIVGAVTGRTTAKLTSLHGLVYDHLLDHFSERRAKEYAAANEAAIDRVAELVEAHDIDCGFARTPAYTYVESRDDRRKVRTEVEAARRLGLPASFVESTDLPYDVEAAVRFDDQARFHPRAYLLELARAFVERGGELYERTPVREVTDGRPCRVTTDRGGVVADDVVLATHFPVVDPALYFARLSPKRSYVLAARLNEAPPEGMYYDPSEPYFSVRPRPTADESMVLVGGENHRTGETRDTDERYRRLERRARERFDVASVEYRWSTQDYVSVDRVPFVGRLAPHRRNLWVATGFGGWGLTNGVAAAERLRDLILGRESPEPSVFRPARLELGASFRRLVSHNAHSSRRFVTDRLVGGSEAAGADGSAAGVDDLSPGEADVFDHRGDSVAAFRDEDGTVHAVSAVCSHLGCLVTWNGAERSWDCPCHGSRFDVDGTVLDTPAVDNLEPYDLDGSTADPS